VASMFEETFVRNIPFYFERKTLGAPGTSHSHYWDRLASSAILVLGAARSGTTWLAKIIDSHPDILYRHEPDEFIQPRMKAELGAAAGASDQIRVWVRQRSLRCATKRPFFPKSWRPAPLALIRQGLAVVLAGTQRIRSMAAMTGGLGLPDLVAVNRRASVRAAIKLVNWDASLAAAALPNCRCCFILRHPCGQVASVLAGWAEGRFGSAAHGAGAAVDLVAAAALAATRGISASAFVALPDAAKLAWTWLAFNEHAIAGLRNLPNARVVVYEDLCRGPEDVARDLFAFAGLDWHPQTSAFLQTSTSDGRSGGYFDVFRVTQVAAERWRQTMKREDQDSVEAVVRGSALAHYWPDLNRPAIAADRPTTGG
jgi:hypothetical protein